MEPTVETSILDRLSQTIPLVCPCGLPLVLARVREAKPNKEWILGHIEKACSPLITGSSPEMVLEELGRVLAKHGRCETAKEYLAERLSKTPAQSP